jgi:hypothetical protein
VGILKNLLALWLNVKQIVMRKAAIILSAFALIVCSYGQATKKQTFQTSENFYAFSEQKYLIKDNGVDIFVIGQKIPTLADGYLITKSIQIRTEEGEDYEIPVYTVTEDGHEILNIEPQYDDEGKIGNIYILSEKYKTAEKIGLYSTIEEFAAAYPDYFIWYSYISDRYVIETKQLNSIQFVLDGNDFIEEGGPEFDSDMTILKISDFKKGSKIKEIRIWG